MGMTGEELKQARKDSGLTQAALGSRLGVSARTWRNWEDLTQLPTHLEERVLHALRGDREEAEIPEDLWEMSNLRLISQLQQIVAVLTSRLDEYSLKEGSDPVGPRMSAPERTVSGPSEKDVIDGTLGKRPRSADGE